MTFRTARAAATTTVVLSTTAVPAILAATGTWTPQLPSPATARQWIAQPMSTGFVIVLAEAAAVALWLLLATAILTHAYAALARRLRWTTTLRLPGPLQGLTAALLGATAVTTATGATAHANPATDTSNSAMPAAEPTTTTSTSHHHASPDPRPAAQTPTYTVRRGDSLCRIAARTLGDADRWPEIFALNRGTRFPHVGGTLRDPNIIYPGWTLDLPADADPPPHGTPAC
ncbi:LysM peptidoglycan-binding domain-containing protein [Micromonospora chaiyaphumensis]|nr:LysM peptidoglycan-binding domain-containing protein [Micromonospora chaiyaphumensis]